MTDRDNGEPTTLLSTTQARQGVTNHNVRYVLAFGLIGAILALGLAALFL